MRAKRRLRGDRCQCSRGTGGCGEYFNSTYAFDQHRTGRPGIDRRCLTVAEMEARGFVKNAAAFWKTRVSPMALGRGERPGTAIIGSDALPDHPLPTGAARPGRR